MLSGLDALLGGLGRLAELAHPQTFEPTMDEQARAVLAAVKDKYGVYQPGWAPLADSTVLERHALGFPDDEPLLRTGGLRDANTCSVETDGDELVAWIGVPEGDPHAAIALAQELGTLAPRVIPPRPVLEPTAQAMGAEIADHVGSEIAVRLG